MFLVGLNKTGIWTMLVLLLLGVSLYPACGRPSFQEADEDTVAQEDHMEDEDHVEVQDEDESDEDEDDVEFDSTARPMTKEECEKLRQDQAKKAEFVKMCEETGIISKDKRTGGGGAAGASDEFDN